jgi:outer membrane autotransporter protein
MPVYQPGRSWAALNLGLSAELTPAWSANVNVGGQAGQSDINTYYGHVGVAYKF